jgi:CubicO group peptidase (beta-lactamase class C family)
MTDTVIAGLGSAGLVEGHAGEAFGPVVDAFVADFRERGEVGGALAVYVRGEPVVDLWGGLADPRDGRPWTASTPAIVFSCTKGVLAICCYLLVQEGRLDLDAPVVRYWPEFGAMGKSEIPVRWLLTHRAGLSALDRPFSRAEVLAWHPVIRAIEAQAPLWPPGTAYSYHTLTYGWLVGEVIRRVTGERVGSFVRRRLAQPLGLRLWIGLPADERDDVAWLLAPLPDTDPELARRIGEALADPAVERAATMGGAFAFPADGDHVTFNDADIQAAEVPGANGIGDARSLARLYAACVHPVGGRRLMTEASVEDALMERSSGQQWFFRLDRGERWGTGFAISSPPISPLLGARSFGHGGAGGQLAFADDEHGVGFAYVNNQMGGVPDDRARLLVEAVRRCLGT